MTTALRHLVCYHYPCPDGIFSAFAAGLRFRETRLPVKFFPLTVYNSPAPKDLGLEGDEVVYFLDYTGPHGFVQKVADLCRRVVVLDHHKTAISELSPPNAVPANVELHLDMNCSGATLSLDYFRPEVSEATRQMFKYIEDGDLWRWALPDSKAFSAGLGAYRLEYDVNKNPDIFDQLLSLTSAQIINKGREVQARQELLISRAVEQQSFVVQLGGSEGSDCGWSQCLAVEAGDDDEGRELVVLRSGLGNKLAVASSSRGLAPMGALAYDPDESAQGRVKVSLRSIGEEDTTLISERYEGGGHKNASAFIIPQALWHSWRR